MSKKTLSTVLTELPELEWEDSFADISFSRILKNGKEIANSNTYYRAKYHACQEIMVGLGLTDKSTIAFIGGGTCCMPRALPNNVDIYEIEPLLEDEIRARYPEHQNRWNFIVGDYKTYLKGEYDFIIYDIPDEPDDELLRQHLTEGGSILTP